MVQIMKDYEVLAAHAAMRAYAACCISHYISHYKSLYTLLAAHAAMRAYVACCISHYISHYRSLYTLIAAQRN